ncbi:MAG TPA: DUF6596 domain-containing protein [Allosphingosinicella sp.]|uniref:RNA polymerase sigma factor n=1 Tax=Allosphingosinicella sp. TaxID=2823234 RepID=UPI002EDA064C
MTAPLSKAVREAGARIVAALAARYRDLDLAEEAFAEACARAAEKWEKEPPERPDAWLYRAAERCALDLLRKRRVRERLAPEPPEPEPNAEEVMMDDASLIPDERLRLIFVCCHPAVAPESRAALTLRLICGLSTAEIARSFLLAEPTLAQRLVRAKRKIAEAGVPFEIPGPQLWAERLDAVLSTLEVAYSKAHEDAAAAGPHAGYAGEMLDLTRTLAELLPDEPEVLALAAIVRFAEARRPARMGQRGEMIPLSEQDPTLWNRRLIDEGNTYLRRVAASDAYGSRAFQAAIHGAWCARRSLEEPAPWPRVLALYDALLTRRDDPIVRINRAVALAEVEGAEAALEEIEALDAAALAAFLPYHAVRADLLKRTGRPVEARAAYDVALALEPGPAEAAWLRERRDA